MTIAELSHLVKGKYQSQFNQTFSIVSLGSEEDGSCFPDNMKIRTLEEDIYILPPLSDADVDVLIQDLTIQAAEVEKGKEEMQKTKRSPLMRLLK